MVSSWPLTAVQVRKTRSRPTRELPRPVLIGRGTEAAEVVQGTGKSLWCRLRYECDAGVVLQQSLGCTNAPVSCKSDMRRLRGAGYPLPRPCKQMQGKCQWESKINNIIKINPQAALFSSSATTLTTNTSSISITWSRWYSIFCQNHVIFYHFLPCSPSLQKECWRGWRRW